MFNSFYYKYGFIICYKFLNSWIDLREVGDFGLIWFNRKYSSSVCYVILYLVGELLCYVIIMNIC